MNTCLYLWGKKNYYYEFLLEYNVIKKITLEIRDQIVKYEGYFIFPLQTYPSFWMFVNMLIDMSSDSLCSSAQQSFIP